jgi:hypothetical protein
MALLKLEPFPDFSKTLERNRWADFIELLCLENLDKEISLNDIITIYIQEGPFESSIGDDDHGEKMDKLRAQFMEIYRYIFSRMTYMKDFYPFSKIDEDTIKASVLDDKKLMYIFLLFASNTRYFINKKVPPVFTTGFERISINILKLIYPNFQSELFGTTSQKGGYFHGGLLLDKLKILATCLNTNLSDKANKSPQFKNPSGDAGIDLVSFIKLDFDTCKSSMLPVCMGQCSCSYDDWIQKQMSIHSFTMNNFFNDFARCHEYMFIPFPLRGISGDWADEEMVKIQTIIIDRVRFLNILEKNGINSLLTDDILKHLAQYLRALNVILN